MHSWPRRAPSTPRSAGVPHPSQAGADVTPQHRRHSAASPQRTSGTGIQTSANPRAQHLRDCHTARPGHETSPRTPPTTHGLLPAASPSPHPAGAPKRRLPGVSPGREACSGPEHRPDVQLPVLLANLAQLHLQRGPLDGDVVQRPAGVGQLRLVAEPQAAHLPVAARLVLAQPLLQQRLVGLQRPHPLDVGGQAVIELPQLLLLLQPAQPRRAQRGLGGAADGAAPAGRRGGQRRGHGRLRSGPRRRRDRPAQDTQRRRRPGINSLQLPPARAQGGQLKGLGLRPAAAPARPSPVENTFLFFSPLDTPHPPALSFTCALLHLISPMVLPGEGGEGKTYRSPAFSQTGARGRGETKNPSFRKMHDSCSDAHTPACCCVSALTVVSGIFFFFCKLFS